MKLELPPKPRRGISGRLRDAAVLGEILRERRKSLGMAQGQLAEVCHCSPHFMSELERGVAGGYIKQVIAVCREVGIDLFARPRGKVEIFVYRDWGGTKRSDVHARLVLQ